MRILILIERFLPEDRANAQLYYELAKGLVERGHQVGVITKLPTGYVSSDGGTRAARPLSQERLDGIDIIRVRGLSSLSRILVLRALDHLIAGLTFALAARKWRKADLLLIYSPPLPLGLAGWLYQKLTGSPYVLNLHDIYPQTVIDLGLLKNPIAIRLAEAIEAMTYRYAAHIVVPAPSSRDVLVNRKRVNPRKVDHVFNWVDTERISPGPKKNDFRRRNSLLHRFIVSYTGSMGFGQDLTPVLTSARALGHRKDIVFLLVGDGVYREKWMQMAEGMDNVRFLPMQPKEQFFEILRASDICLVPLAGALKSPAIPGKTQNIMAVARPVIAIVDPSGDAAELITKSGCGFVVKPEEPDEVVRIINQLYEDRTLGERMGASGRTFAEQHFSLQRATDKFAAIFKTVLSQRQILP